MAEYDVYLNGNGYMLVKDASGELASGAQRAQHVDPFSRYASEEGRYEIAKFGFGGGVGARKFSAGREQYRWGARIDTRSKQLLRGPEMIVATSFMLDDYVTVPAAVSGLQLDSTHYDKFAIRFQAPVANTDVRSFGILVRRDPDVDYAGAAQFTVDIWSDTPGPPPVPNGQLTHVHMDLDYLADEWLPDEDAWMNGEYFWLTGSLGAAWTLTANAYYWLVIDNSGNTAPLFWGLSTAPYNTNRYVAYDTGTGWVGNVAMQPSPFVKLRPLTGVDREVRCFADFRGADQKRRVYAGVGPKVMYVAQGASIWANSKSDFTGPVRALCVYQGPEAAPQLIAAQGPGLDMWRSDGTTATSTWVVMNTGGGAPRIQGQCLCIHDGILWIADGPNVYGIGSPLTMTPGGAVRVGDGGTPVTSFVSHDGHLYALKPEGVFEITYLSGSYPGSGLPTAHEVMSFATDRAGRPWALSWNSGLYFPSAGGIYEWKSSVLQNIWKLYVEDNAVWPGAGGDPAPIGYWQAACRTTRGALLTQHVPNLGVGGFWWFDGNSFVPLLWSARYAEPLGGVHVTSVGGGKGWAYIGYGFHIPRIRWPIWTDNMRLDNSARFTSSGVCWLPQFGADKPTWPKNWLSLRFLTRNAGTTGNAIYVYYSVNDAESFHYLGDGPVVTSPVQVLPFPATCWGYTLDLLLILAGTDNTQSQVVEAVELLYQSLPDTVTQFQLWINNSAVVERRNGVAEERRPLTRRAELEALLELFYPFAYVDEMGTTHYVRAIGLTEQDAAFLLAGETTGQVVQQGLLLTLLKIGDVAQGAAGAPAVWGMRALT